MACSKCGTKTAGCGCSDTAYTTAPQTSCPPNTQCPTPEICSEYVNTRCVYSAQIGILGLGIDPNESMQQILQRLDILLGATPGCADPTSACQSTTLVYPVEITQTTATFSWEASSTADDYQVEYKLSSAGGWTLLPVQAATEPTQILITGLTANSTYYVRVNSICPVGNCYSATLIFNTLA